MVAELVWNTFRDHLIAEYEIPKYEGDLGHPNLFVPLTRSHRRSQARAPAGALSLAARQALVSIRDVLRLMALRGVEAGADLAEAFHVRKLVT